MHGRQGCYRQVERCCSIAWLLSRAEGAISSSWQPRLQGFGLVKRFLSSGCREGCPGKRFLLTSLSMSLSTSTADLSPACSSHYHPSRSSSTPTGSRHRHQPSPSSLPFPCHSFSPHCQPPGCLPPCTGSPEHTKPLSHTPAVPLPQHPCLCVPRRHLCLDRTPRHWCCPRTLSCCHTATLLRASRCLCSLSRTAGDECLALERMPASLCGHRLVMVPSARPAWGWKVNVSLFLSAPP